MLTPAAPTLDLVSTVALASLATGATGRTAQLVRWTRTRLHQAMARPVRAVPLIWEPMGPLAAATLLRAYAMLDGLALPQWGVRRCVVLGRCAQMTHVWSAHLERTKVTPAQARHARIALWTV